ncbi:MAG TPA: tRNA-dihydrouridine synthase [Candidatus Doudnabacteria bacterium]|nr:tRNA-dihydrouridine synthase [Candidatus Doudnabacteria bacterium]
MTYGFWKNLPKPFFALAPMYDVTDAAFRFIIAKYGKPDVSFTEFTSTDGLSSDKGRPKLLHHLKFDPSEQPVVAQVFGAQPDNYTTTAQLVRELGFAGLDINMGCPDKNIIKNGSCAALFHTPKLAQEIVLASKAGAGELPVSVKIRIGDTKIDWRNWISALLEVQPAAISIHLRTRKEMSKVPAHWELMPEIVKFIIGETTEETRPIIIGNGDVMNLAEAREKAAATGCDGVMLGRAIFGNPWLFSKRTDEPSQTEKINILIEHIALYDKMFANIKHYDVMKRHFKAYIQGFDGAAELRAKLYETRSAEESIAILKNSA